MYREALVIAGSLVVAFSFLPYLIDVIKQKIKPRIATWITWSLITTISTFAAISAHAYTSALLTGAASIIEVLILIFALRNKDVTYQKLDFLSQAISLVGIILWIVSKNPAFALAFNIIADISANVPTLYHGWVAPYEESYLSFFIFALGSLLTLLSVTTNNFVNLAFPIYLTIDPLILGLNIYIRQRLVKK